MGMEVNKIGFYINKRAFKIACVLGFLLLYFVLPKNSLAATTLQKPPLQNLGLVGYWTFNGSDYNGASTTAEVLDRSGQGNNGDAIGGPTRITGKLGQALSFDGTDDYVNVPDPASGVLDFGTATNFTLSAWVNVPSTSPGQDFFNKTESSSLPPGFSFFQSNFADSSYTIRVGLDSDVGYCQIRGSTNIADNNWHHITGVVFRRASCTTSDILIYVDGVLQSGAVILDTDNTNADLSSSEPLRIGAYEDSGVLGYSQVKLDEVRIYNRALLGNEVLKLYNSGQVKFNASQNSGNGTLDSGLVGLWSFNGADYNAASTTAEVLDRSGQGNNGDAQNGPTRTIGKLGQALNFKASNDSVNAGDISLTDSQTAITWSFWLNQVAYQSGDCYLTKSDPNGLTQMSWEICNEPTSWLGNEDDIMIHISTALNSSDYVNATCYPQDFNINLNEWMHVIVVYDGSQTGNTNRLKIYKNGTQISFTGGECSGTIPASTTNSSSAVVIGDSSDGTRNIDASIDEVRIYNRVLSTNEIKQLYNLGGDKVNSSQNSRLTSGLVGLWSFNGADYNAASTTAEVLDRSGQGNNGDAQNGPTRTIGKLGQGLNFDGTDDRVNMASPTSLDNIETQGGGGMSISFWIKPSFIAGAVGLIQKDGINSGGWVLENNNGNGRLAFKKDYITTDLDVHSGSLNLVVGGAVNPWQHVVMSWDGTNNSTSVIFYINGVSQISTGTAGVGGKNSDAALNFIAGGSSDWTDYPGILDELRVYNKVLTADEVKQLYNMGR